MKFRTVLTGIAALYISSSSEFFGDSSLTVSADVVVEDVEVSTVPYTHYHHHNHLIPSLFAHRNNLRAP